MLRVIGVGFMAFGVLGLVVFAAHIAWQEVKTLRHVNQLGGGHPRIALTLRQRLARRLDPKAYHDLEQETTRYRAVWEDHLSRCLCHDSWDQCPCQEEGHHAFQITWRGGTCQCCRWCSPNRSGKPSPFMRDRAVS